MINIFILYFSDVVYIIILLITYTSEIKKIKTLETLRFLNCGGISIRRVQNIRGGDVPIIKCD